MYTKNRGYFLFFFVFYLSINDISSVCPNPDLIKPCSCNYNHLKCVGQNGELGKVFERMSNNLSKSEKHFSSLEYTDETITEFKENHFRDITFNSIAIIDCKQLKTIHENTFKTMEDHLGSFLLSSNYQLTFNDGTIFDFFNKFKNLRYIIFEGSDMETIPKNAFTGAEITDLDLIGPSFKTIENNAFSNLKNLQYIYLINTSIEWIPENAFQLGDNPNITFSLELYNNRFINTSNFEGKGLLNTIRKNITIKIQNEYDPVSFLNEKFYQPFLKMNSANTIGVYASLDCDDCRTLWLHNNPDLWTQIINGKEQFSFNDFKIIPNFICSNGKAFNET